MLGVLAIILLIIWLAGLIFHFLGGLIYLFLVASIVAAVIHFLRRGV